MSNYDIKVTKETIENKEEEVKVMKVNHDVEKKFDTTTTKV